MAVLLLAAALPFIMLGSGVFRIYFPSTPEPPQPTIKWAEMYRPAVNDSTINMQLSQAPILSTFTPPPPLPPVTALANPKSTRPPEFNHTSTSLPNVVEEIAPYIKVKLSSGDESTDSYQM